MSEKATYKNRSYNSRSQCALAMLLDNHTPTYIANQLGITVQTVCAAKKRAPKCINTGIKRALRQRERALKAIQKMDKKIGTLMSLKQTMLTTAN